MLEKCVLTVLELNWNKRLGHKKTKLNICHHMLTSSTQLQNRSFHVVERTRTSSKCQKMKYARAKRAKILFFIVKYANLWGFCCRRRRGCLSSLIAETRSYIFRWRSRFRRRRVCLSSLISRQDGLKAFRIFLFLMGKTQKQIKLKLGSSKVWKKRTELIVNYFSYLPLILS